MMMGDFEEAVMDAREWKAKCRKLEAELAATVKDSLTVGKAQMARDSAELRRLCAERDKLKAKAVIPEKARDALARRCLWIAYVWNDHNFRDAYEYAREEAESHGITSFDEANEWLEAKPQSDAVTVPMELANRLVSTDNHVRQTARRELRNSLLGGDK